MPDLSDGEARRKLSDGRRGIGSCKDGVKAFILALLQESISVMGKPALCHIWRDGYAAYFYDQDTQDALDWFLGTNPEQSRITFEECCQFLDIDSRFILRRIKQIVTDRQRVINGYLNKPPKTVTNAVKAMLDRRTRSGRPRVIHVRMRTIEHEIINWIGALDERVEDRCRVEDTAERGYETSCELAYSA